MARGDLLASDRHQHLFPDLPGLGVVGLKKRGSEKTIGEGLHLCHKCT